MANILRFIHAINKHSLSISDASTLVPCGIWERDRRCSVSGSCPAREHTMGAYKTVTKNMSVSQNGGKNQSNRAESCDRREGRGVGGRQGRCGGKRDAEAKQAELYLLENFRSC